jgi:hypothetical protein
MLFQHLAPHGGIKPADAFLHSIASRCSDTASFFAELAKADAEHAARLESICKTFTRRLVPAGHPSEPALSCGNSGNAAAAAGAGTGTADSISAPAKGEAGPGMDSDTQKSNDTDNVGTDADNVTATSMSVSASVSAPPQLPMDTVGVLASLLASVSAAARTHANFAAAHTDAAAALRVADKALSSSRRAWASFAEGPLRDARDTAVITAERAKKRYWEQCAVVDVARTRVEALETAQRNDPLAATTDPDRVEKLDKERRKTQLEILEMNNRKVGPKRNAESESRIDH